MEVVCLIRKKKLSVSIFIDLTVGIARVRESLSVCVCRHGRSRHSMKLKWPSIELVCDGGAKLIYTVKLKTSRKAPNKIYTSKCTVMGFGCGSANGWTIKWTSVTDGQVHMQIHTQFIYSHNQQGINTQKNNSCNYQVTMPCRLALMEEWIFHLPIDASFLFLFRTISLNDHASLCLGALLRIFFLLLSYLLHGLHAWCLEELTCRLCIRYWRFSYRKCTQSGARFNCGMEMLGGFVRMCAYGEKK